MKKQFYLVICLAMLAVGFVGCNGYEDGPAVSLRGKEKRLVGWKKIVTYEVDGVDSLPMVEAAFANTSYDSTGFKWLYEIEGSGIGCTQGCITGYWEFLDNSNELLLRLPSPLFTGEVFPIGNWTILRLTHKEFWLTINSKGKNYLLKLIRTD